MKTSRIFALAIGMAVMGCASLPHPAVACAVCYGAPDSPMTNGLNAGIGVLLGITGIVLAGFAGFIVYLARRARLFQNEKHSENDLQDFAGSHATERVR